MRRARDMQVQNVFFGELFESFYKFCLKIFLLCLCLLITYVLWKNVLERKIIELACTPCQVCRCPVIKVPNCPHSLNTTTYSNMTNIRSEL